MKEQPHPKLGINLRAAIELCGICGTESTIGMVPMGMHNFKYVCPSCGLVHYGAPPEETDGLMNCPKCKTASRAWKMIELQTGEPVKTGVGCCKSCRKRLGKSKVAFVEIKDQSASERTGNVYFVEPPRELAKQLDKTQRVLFAEESWCSKMLKGAGR